ncbi:MAG: bifunctional UDP-N-acetylglucosamine diphosphorylase/glucosamine-1-phosphate N-acetyltransferase GlmU [Granulosicoccaceae bacterium]
MSLSIVILAAGKGTRMNSALPKVLQPLGDRPMLQHVIDTASKLNPSRICVVIGHGAESVRERITSPVEWVMQTEQKGTGHAVQQALPNIPENDNVLVLYGDVPLTRLETLTALTQLDDGLGLLTVDLDDPRGYGRIVRENGEVVAIVEEKDADEEQRAIKETNTGILSGRCGVLNDLLSMTDSNNAQGEYYLTDVFALAHEKGIAIHTAQASDEWEVSGVNNKDQLSVLERQYQSLQVQALLDAGVTVKDRQRLDIRGTVATGKDVCLDVGVVLEGDVKLGDNVSIGPYCVIKNATIEAGTTIAAHTVIEDAQVGGECKVGPFARLRPGAKLSGKNNVGNFVEIKASTIGLGSKVNHLSYVGDAELGERVNVGAGTITCNYDGANKHKTVLGDDVFVGSNSSLVAPIAVGDGVTVGAGSTLSKDVGDGALAFTRAKQKTIDNWPRPTKNKG